jgi:hypothetical protein
MCRSVLQLNHMTLWSEYITQNSGFVSVVVQLLIGGWSDNAVKLPAVLIFHAGLWYFDLGQRDVLNYCSQVFSHPVIK